VVIDFVMVRLGLCLGVLRDSDWACKRILSCLCKRFCHVW